VDFYKSYTTPEIAFVNIGINPNWCVSSWDCRFVLCKLVKTTIILDTETYSCIKITNDGFRQYTEDIWFDGVSLICTGSTAYNYTNPWQAQLLKFDVDLNLLLRKVFHSGDYSVYFYRVIKDGSDIFVSGRWFFSSSGVIYKFTEDFNVQSSYAWGSKSFRVGKIANDIVAGHDDGNLVCLDNTVAGIDFADGRSSNDVYATRTKFFLDKTNYFTITGGNSSITPAWFFSPTKTHACCGGYAVKLDPANDFAVVKALYTPDYDLFGCTDTKFVGKFKPTGNIAIIDAQAGIDSLAQLESFAETSVTVTKQNFSWASTSFGTRDIYESSDPITISDGNCVEVTS